VTDREIGYIVAILAGAQCAEVGGNEVRLWFSLLRGLKYETAKRAAVRLALTDPGPVGPSEVRAEYFRIIKGKK